MFERFTAASGLAEVYEAARAPLGVTARIAIALAFVAPAAIAGYHATHGIVKHTMPSEGWQVAFSVIGAVAIGATALMRLATMATPGSTGQNLARG